jgi:hypothetical protein
MAKAAKARDRVVVRAVVEVERIVEMHAAASAGDADLRPPQTDARAGACHQPCSFSVLTPRDHRQAEHLGVEPERAGEIDDLQHDLADPVIGIGPLNGARDMPEAWHTTGVGRAPRASA